jgi:hypothetical protein
VVVGCAASLAVASSAAAFEPVGQRGTSGAASGELSEPYQGAVDAQGDLFVADSGNSRISEFAPDGSFIKAFGKDVGGLGVNVCTTSCDAGTDDGTAGSMCFPDGLALDPVSGNLVVGDECAHAVMVFTPAGTFVRAFGKDVGGSGMNVCTSSCSTGTSGPGSGEFNTPVSVAINPAGTVFVGDKLNNRIDVLSVTGGFQRAFGANVGGLDIDTCTTSCAAGATGPAAGELASPSGVALDGTGDVFAGEEGNNRVSVFTENGIFERAFGGDVGGSGVNVCTSTCVEGTVSDGAAGQLNEPFEIGFDPTRNEVLAAEFDGDRVTAYTPAGTFVQTFGQDVDQGGGSGFEICTTLCRFGTASALPGSFDEPSGVTVDPSGTVYVSEDNGNRVQLLRDVPPAKPSNALSFGRLHRNKKKGTAVLDVTVAGPGTVTASGKNAGVKQLGATPSRARAAASTVQFLVKAKGKAKKKLGRSGKVKLNLLITFTPTGGDANQQPLRVKLLKKRRVGHRHR